MHEPLPLRGVSFFFPCLCLQMMMVTMIIRTVTKPSAADPPVITRAVRNSALLEPSLLLQGILLFIVLLLVSQSSLDDPEPLMV